MGTERNDEPSGNPAREAIEKIDLKFVETGARQITDEDLETVVRKAEQIKSKLFGEGSLREVVKDADLLVALAEDYWFRRYRRIPFSALAAIVFALLYILDPLDLIPDGLPGVGLLDDVTVLGISLVLVEDELRDYKAWKAAQGSA